MRATITGFVGPNGGGKTLAGVEQLVCEAWASGRPVVSNLALYPEMLGYDEDLAQPLESWTQIPDIRGSLLFLDEISSVFPSRNYSSMPAQLVRVLNQLRKVDVVVGWTAPSWERCDTVLREVTQRLVVCRGFIADRYVRVDGKAFFPRAERDERGKRIRHEAGWLPNRLFSRLTYDVADLRTGLSTSFLKKEKPKRVEWVWRTRREAQYAYSTLEDVGLLDHLDDVGLCVSCGGARARRKCSCDRGAPAPGAGDHDHEPAGLG